MPNLPRDIYRELVIRPVVFEPQAADTLLIKRETYNGITDQRVYDPLTLSANLRITGAVGARVLDTVQDIQAGSSPTFAGLTLTGMGAGATDLVVTHTVAGLFKTRTIDTRVWGSSLVDGTGTASYLPYWVDGNTIGNSVVYTNGTGINIGAGALAPVSLLEVYSNSAHPIVTISGVHATDYDPQIQFRTDDAPTVKWSAGVDATDDSFEIKSGVGGIGGSSEFNLTTTGLEVDKLGVNIAPHATRQIYAKSPTSIASAYDNIYSSVVKSGGASTWSHTMRAGNFYIEYNDNGQVVGNLTGIMSYIKLRQGIIGDNTYDRRLTAGYFNVLAEDLLGGSTIWGEVNGFYALMDLRTGVVLNGDAYAMHIKATVAATVSGKTAMLYLEETAGVDYGLWQDGTATHYLQGNVQIASDTTGLMLGAGQDMSMLYNGTTGVIDTSLVGASDLVATCGAEKTLLLTTEVWEDLPTPFDAAKVPASNMPTWAGFIGNLNAYTFDIGDYLEITTEVLHGYKEGEDIEVHVHWATNGQEVGDTAVNWEVEWSIANSDPSTGVGDAFGATTTDTTETTIPGATPDLTHMYTSVETIPGAAVTIGAIIKARVRRVAAVGTDPAADPFGLMLGVHYPKDTMGSRTLGAK